MNSREGEALAEPISLRLLLLWLSSPFQFETLSQSHFQSAVTLDRTHSVSHELRSNKRSGQQVHGVFTGEL